ncbi:MAG: phosphoribosylformylglycinamidine synthase subunit PurQ [Ignavibacteria bacterium]|jgi:phosphoribosylformylglycinamidine synthase
MKPKIGIAVFPGSNCDHDTYYAINELLGYEAKYIWHKEKTIGEVDAIVLPGGFSYGDYLRTGAIARFSPIMDSVIDFAEKGGVTIGICNGFQILLECGLLPGVMQQNNSLKFVSRDIYLKIENLNTPFSNSIPKRVIKVPVAHGDGNYYADEETVRELEDNNQVVFRYSSNDGSIKIEDNPNGSINNIAGIINKKQNILGMMPHPERCSDPVLRKNDGRFIFESMAKSLLN